MKFDSAGGVSVAELIVYIPAIIIAFIICSRHGFNRSSGWIYTLILCLVRIVGAVCQLLTYNNTSTGLLKTTLIIDSIGLSPLLLATLGMLSRLVDWINTNGNGILNIKHFRLLQLLITLGLILSIAGGSSGSSSDGSAPTPSTTSQASIILFIVAYVGICLIWFISLSGMTIVPGTEKKISVFVLIALPFILVRLAYSTLAVFLHNSTFSIIDGSTIVHACMAVLEEFVVVGLYLLLGFLVRPLGASEQGPIASRQWKERKPKRSSSGSKLSNHQRNSSRSRPRPNDQYDQEAPISVAAPSPYHPHPVQYHARDVERGGY